MRTRSSEKCLVAIVHPNLRKVDVEKLEELSKEYANNYVEVYSDESRISEDAKCRISIFCDTPNKPPENYPDVLERPYDVIVEEKIGEKREVTMQKKYKTSDELLEGLHDIIETVTDSEQEREDETSRLHSDSEDEEPTRTRQRSAAKRENKSPHKRDEPKPVATKGKRKKKSQYSETDSPPISRPATVNTKEGDRESVMNNEQHKSPDFHLMMILIIFASLALALYLSTSEDSVTKSLPERYHEQLEKLKSSHQKQDGRLWRVINATMKSHILADDPRQPAVLMLASSSQTAAIREKLAREIARIYSMRCNETDFMEIDGPAYSSLEHTTAKERLDTKIHSGFAAGSCAVIVSNFEELPPASTTVFYQFCENDYAPYKKVLVLFTTEISNWDWMGEDRSRFLIEDKTPKPQFWSRVIESYLEYSLQNNDDSGKMTVDMIGGLLTRITPLVAWVGRE